MINIDNYKLSIAKNRAIYTFLHQFVLNKRNKVGTEKRKKLKAYR